MSYKRSVVFMVISGNTGEFNHFEYGMRSLSRMSLLYFIAPWDHEVTKESVCMIPVDPMRCTRMTASKTISISQVTAH